MTQDYTVYAQVLSKFPGNDSLVTIIYQRAIDNDTVQDEKLDILKKAADNAKQSGNKKANAYWQGKLYAMKKNPANSDLYNWGIANYQAGNYSTSDSIFCGLYESKYPNEIFGYLWCARSKQAQDDSVGSAGLAVEPYQKLAEIGRSLDSVKYKPQIIQSYSFLAAYYNNVKKDKPTAISYLKKILEVDPTNPDAPKFIEILERPVKQPAQKPKPKATK